MYIPTTEPANTVSRRSRKADIGWSQRIRLVALLSLAALTLAACAAEETNPPATSSSQPVSDPVVTIEDFSFQDGQVTIEAGTTVTWVWEDAPVEHNVVSDDDLFESPLQASGTWTYTFEETGSYSYHCGPHPDMTGVITVVEPPS